MYEDDLTGSFLNETQKIILERVKKSITGLSRAYY
jgi:hypothetical protein